MTKTHKQVEGSTIGLELVQVIALVFGVVLFDVGMAMVSWPGLLMAGGVELIAIGMLLGFGIAKQQREQR